MFKALYALAALVAALVGVVILAVPGAWIAWRYDRLTTVPSYHFLFWTLKPPTALQPLGAGLAALQRRDAGALAHAAAVEVAEARIAQEADAREAAAQAKIVTVYRTIHDQIPVLIPPAVDRDFPLSVGFVRLHDAAALGELSILSEPAAEADDTASPVTESQAASVIAGNYGECRADQERLRALQDWDAAESAVSK